MNRGASHRFFPSGRSNLNAKSSKIFASHPPHSAADVGVEAAARSSSLEPPDPLRASFQARASSSGVSQCTTHDLAPTCLAMHQSSYRYPLMPLHASTMTTGPSLWRDRSTVALRSPRVFFSTWPLAYAALRCRCSDGSSTTVTLIPFSRRADASSAAAVDLPLHGTPHMITRQPLAGVISVVSAHRRCRRSSTGSPRRGRPIRRPPMCRAPAELANKSCFVGSSGKNASRSASSQGTRAGRPPRTPWVG